ncbi:TrbG/VirB9 family P-type conjugative transfer protein [Erythrobacter sp. HKB08]|uniref:TrbG/VirB9 family P-type conjugative transfer protein n=1 Tax=Erythrobacter sp. HKB08 TaxID=2502843 RepID=UPI0010092E0D|nr:TrbG/VirB9 family P-type conjugative transfer protein [Erythrobacter sp. HKB08]
MRIALAILPMCLAGLSPLAAQVSPVPAAENPRIQSVQWTPGEPVILTALPMTTLTVLLEPGEQIERITSDNTPYFQVNVSAEGDGLQIRPLADGATGNLRVETATRTYEFSLRTSSDLMAAYLVRFDYGAAANGLAAEQPAMLAEPEPTGETWRYRVRGDREVRPSRISDDGRVTRIEFAPDQPLPAVFAIGPTGDEQVVNGHMRGDVFVIDRVWQRLVFRIDKEKATARRNERPEQVDG